MDLRAGTCIEESLRDIEFDEPFAPFKWTYWLVTELLAAFDFEDRDPGFAPDAPATDL